MKRWKCTKKRIVENGKKKRSWRKMIFLQLDIEEKREKKTLYKILFFSSKS